jgi:acetyl-CoA synthetase/4-hydroxybutyrate---CoA ligase (AMP-forming)
MIGNPPWMEGRMRFGSFGRPSPMYDVILANGYEPSKDLALKLFQHTIDALAKFKIPRIIEFVDELPKTISGKIRRVELRETEEKKKQDQAVAAHEYFYHQFPALRSKTR